MRILLALALVASLAACKPAVERPAVAEDTVDAPPMPEAKANLDAEGLRFVDKASGKTSLLAFGVPRAEAEEALARVDGKADDRSTNEECGAGPMEFTRFDAMTLNFQDGKFVGWFLGNENGASQYSTMSGIAIGTTRAKAKQSVSIVDVPDSTLGEEFSIGTGDHVMGGIFAEPGEDAKIDALFAGANCFFR
ncbi:MAG: hypothetical protein ACTHJU_08215 [Sphingopyxis sp.]